MSLPRKYMVEKAGLRDLRSLPPALCPQPGGILHSLVVRHCIHPWRRHPEPDFGCERWEGTENGKEPVSQG